MGNISCIAKVFRRLIPSIILIVVLVSLTSIAAAQEGSLPSDALTPISHDIDTWEAKVAFYREVEAHQLLLAEHTANTWEAKVAFYREWEFQQLMVEHAARTWEAKAASWRNWTVQ